MTAKDDLTKVKQALDQVTEDFFDMLQSLFQTHAKLESLMRDGFFSLSRARYHMGGTRNIGALQFEKNELEMEPLIIVDVNSEDDNLCNRDDNDPWPELEMKLVQKQLNLTKKIILNDTVTVGQQNTSDLRQRKGVSRHSGDGGDSVETVGMQELSLNNKGGEVKGKEERKSADTPKLKDPLKLFGVLLSPNLRQCQTSFKQALEVVVQIANTKHRLQGLQHQFQDLQKQKLRLIAKS